MNRLRLTIIRTIFTAYFFTIASTTAYALWGISTTTAIAVSAVIGCFGYEHKRIDDLNNQIREQTTTQRRTSTYMQTLASNVSSLASNVQTHITNQNHSYEHHDLQNVYDSRSSEEGYTAPAQLPHVVLLSAHEEHAPTIPVPAQHE